MDNELYDKDGELKCCPNCKSVDIKRIEEELMIGLGLYQIYDFIGGINKLTNQYQCSQCHYQF